MMLHLSSAPLIVECFTNLMMEDKTGFAPKLLPRLPKSPNKNISEKCLNVMETECNKSPAQLPGVHEIVLVI